MRMVGVVDRLADAAPLTSMCLGSFLLVGVGFLVLPEVFGFFWFYLTLPAYLLLISGVDVGAVLGVAGPPFVTLALFGFIDVLVAAPWSRQEPGHDGRRPTGRFRGGRGTNQGHERR